MSDVCAHDFYPLNLGKVEFQVSLMCIPHFPQEIEKKAKEKDKINTNPSKANLEMQRCVEILYDLNVSIWIFFPLLLQ